eukprot:Clim_evm10s58 gene=Clim_evmTU10s58
MAASFPAFNAQLALPLTCNDSLGRDLNAQECVAKAAGCEGAAPNPMTIVGEPGSVTATASPDHTTFSMDWQSVAGRIVSAVYAVDAETGNRLGDCAINQVYTTTSAVNVGECNTASLAWDVDYGALGACATFVGDSDAVEENEADQRIRRRYRFLWAFEFVEPVRLSDADELIVGRSLSFERPVTIDLSVGTNFVYDSDEAANVLKPTVALQVLSGSVVSPGSDVFEIEVTLLTTWPHRLVLGEDPQEEGVPAQSTADFFKPVALEETAEECDDGTTGLTDGQTGTVCRQRVRLEATKEDLCTFLDQADEQTLPRAQTVSLTAALEGLLSMQCRDGVAGSTACPTPEVVPVRVVNFDNENDDVDERPYTLRPRELVMDGEIIANVADFCKDVLITDDDNAENQQEQDDDETDRDAAWDSLSLLVTRTSVVSRFTDQSMQTLEAVPVTRAPPVVDGDELAIEPPFTFWIFKDILLFNSTVLAFPTEDNTDESIGPNQGGGSIDGSGTNDSDDDGTSFLDEEQLANAGITVPGSGDNTGDVSDSSGNNSGPGAMHPVLANDEFVRAAPLVISFFDSLHPGLVISDVSVPEAWLCAEVLTPGEEDADNGADNDNTDEGQLDLSLPIPRSDSLAATDVTPAVLDASEVCVRVEKGRGLPNGPGGNLPGFHGRCPYVLDENGTLLDVRTLPADGPDAPVRAPCFVDGLVLENASFGDYPSFVKDYLNTEAGNGDAAGSDVDDAEAQAPIVVGFQYYAAFDLDVAIDGATVIDADGNEVPEGETGTGEPPRSPWGANRRRRRRELSSMALPPLSRQTLHR